MGHQTPRRPGSHLLQTMPYIVCITLCLAPCHGELTPFKENENIWVYLAKNVLNTSDFCLAGGTYIEQTFASYIVGVCAPLESLRNYTLFKYINKTITYADIYNFGPSVNLKDREMFSIKVTQVAPAGECANFVNCTKNCFVLSADVKMDCNTTTDISYAHAHVKLPAGWFLICGRTVYSYVPANSSGGPCSLGRLTVFMPQKPHPTGDPQEFLLTLNCDNYFHLFSLTEHMLLTTFVVPAVATSLNMERSTAACTLAKVLNATIQAIGAISQELGQAGEVALQNRAALDYLLLRHNHGCEGSKELCCFNLTDDSQLIEQPNEGFFGIDLSTLTSWLPSITGLREAFVVFILFIFFSIIACCYIQCVPLCSSAMKCTRHTQQQNEYVQMKPISKPISQK
ncbi:syncytin-B-like [Phyllostomus hastatus]|uniref:syncytin-B-like n=1 Tax=Phyllostomus hastatus TaxID=9423 RepID=UPI001E68481C|nr:syncytin-B-like [Phyllostomus hastatus]XP_045677566.1 syncytin-B-like [Phyllostomus hastatus]XP_045677567.1 syncytin-B-like [Phyllostomus hastatus]XP_045677568.1 syncytin-B-like [Phyllostomus hastatus]